MLLLQSQQTRKRSRLDVRHPVATGDSGRTAMGIEVAPYGIAVERIRSAAGPVTEVDLGEGVIRTRLQFVWRRNGCCRCHRALERTGDHSGERLRTQLGCKDTRLRLAVRIQQHARCTSVQARTRAIAGRVANEQNPQHAYELRLRMPPREG